MKSLLIMLQIASLLSAGAYAPPRLTIVFWGDSITARWNVSAAFPLINAVNAGIGGQTSEQILARFESDVAPHHPTLVVIEAGTNDLYDTDTAADATVTNVQTMIDHVRSLGATPILTSLVPIDAALWNAHFGQSALLALNARLRDLATANGVAFADYYTALAQPNLTVDGLHPNRAGYAVLCDVLQRFLP